MYLPLLSSIPLNLLKLKIIAILLHLLFPTCKCTLWSPRIYSYKRSKKLKSNNDNATYTPNKMPLSELTQFSSFRAYVLKFNPQQPEVF